VLLLVWWLAGAPVGGPDVSRRGDGVLLVQGTAPTPRSFAKRRIERSPTLRRTRGVETVETRWRNVPAMEERDLVDAFRRGDDAAFRRLYATYGRLVYGVSYGVLGERSLAEEATQQTFVRAWEHASSFESGHELAPWLAVIAKRIAIDLWRRERRRVHDPLDELATAADPRHADAVEDVWSIRAALDEMGEDARSLLQLQYRDGFTQQEVADRLGVPVGTVKSRTHTAQSRLAVALRRHGVARPRPRSSSEREPT